MTAGQLRAMREANPFRPFTIRLADGRALAVPHRDFVSQSPGGRTIIVYQSGNEEAFSVVDLYLVTELEVQAQADSGSNAG
ncbi:MAG TPA: hypothetical protein VKE98_17860 [Gemmataceae bacterium]|nr:hypothetical protein [Gemmataceae bacterium]